MKPFREISLCILFIIQRFDSLIVSKSRKEFFEENSVYPLL
jgi:hypothetical protein